MCAMQHGWMDGLVGDDVEMVYVACCQARTSVGHSFWGVRFFPGVPCSCYLASQNEQLRSPELASWYGRGGVTTQGVTALGAEVAPLDAAIDAVAGAAHCSAVSGVRQAHAAVDERGIRGATDACTGVSIR